MNAGNTVHRTDPNAQLMPWFRSPAVRPGVVPAASRVCRRRATSRVCRLTSTRQGADDGECVPRAGLDVLTWLGVGHSWSASCPVSKPSRDWVSMAAQCGGRRGRCRKAACSSPLRRWIEGQGAWAVWLTGLVLPLGQVLWRQLGWQLIRRVHIREVGHVNSLMLGLATCVAVVMVSQGVLTASRHGAAMYLSPRIFPVAYVAVACLAPTYWIYHVGPLVNISADSVAENTPVLMSLSVISFAVGAGMKWRPVDISPRGINVKSLLVLSRLLFLFPLLLSAFRFNAGYLATRGQGQDVRGAADVLAVAAIVAAPVAVLLIGVARRQRRFPYAAIDVCTIVAFLILQGLNGDRASSIGVVLAAICAVISRPSARVRLRVLALGLVAIIGLSYVTSTYRSAQRDPSAHSMTAAETILQDLVSVPYTTGVVAMQTRHAGFEEGSTIVAALIRQLPSPIAVSLIGPVDDTGAFVFRTMVQIDDSQGLGFSIPAEGALNFGTWGVVGASFVYGLALSWLFSRASFASGTALGLLYFIAFATLPFAWRADALGAIKGVLYSAVLLIILLAVSRISKSDLDPLP